MSLNSTPSSERVHIGFFGCRNAGKSSLVNAVTGQDMNNDRDVRYRMKCAVDQGVVNLKINTPYYFIRKKCEE